jgi:hypothetical protein
MRLGPHLGAKFMQSGAEIYRIGTSGEFDVNWLTRSLAVEFKELWSVGCYGHQLGLQHYVTVFFMVVTLYSFGTAVQTLVVFLTNIPAVDSSTRICVFCKDYDLFVGIGLWYAYLHIEDTSYCYGSITHNAFLASILSR